MFLVPLYAQDRVEPTTPSMSPSTSESVSFERKQFTVNRHKGKVFIDGAELHRFFPDNKSKEVRLIEVFDGLSFSTDRQFQEWAQKLRGTRTYTYDEVTRMETDGSRVTKPLVFFEREQRIELDKLWNAWLDERQAQWEETQRVRALQEEEAKQYQQATHLLELQSKGIAAQVAAAERSADSLVVISGATSLWEVELIPAGSSEGSYFSPQSLGVFSVGTQSTGISLFVGGGGQKSSTFGTTYQWGSVSNSLTVRAYGRTSQIASDSALHSNPGYRVASIRKLAGY